MSLSCSWSCINVVNLLLVSLVCLCHAKSVSGQSLFQVCLCLDYVWMFEYHVVNKLHLGSHSQLGQVEWWGTGRMAARTVAALAFGALLFLLLCVFLFITSVKHNYSRQELLDIGFQHKITVTHDFYRTHNIPKDFTRPPGSPWIVVGLGGRHRRRRERKQKRGCRASLLIRLRKQPYKPPLPSMFLTNARSMAHKMDRGGGVCIYAHYDWSNNSIIIDSHCSPDLEFMTVKCRPFFLPRELTVVIVTAVYIPPDANVSTALAILLDAINKQLRAHPNGAHTIAGDFNQADLKTVFTHFFQHVKCPTRGDNTLDRVYTNIKHAYSAFPFPYLGQSDHLSLLLTSAYISLRRRTTPLTNSLKSAKPVLRTIKRWTNETERVLQACSDLTDWTVF